MEAPPGIDATLGAWAERTAAGDALALAQLRWVGSDGIAAMLGFKPRYLLENVAGLPDFPQPLRIRGDGHPKWNVAEVQAWALAHRERYAPPKAS